MHRFKPTKFAPLCHFPCVTIMIMSFYKKGLHSFLGFTNPNDTTPLPPPPQNPPKCHHIAGLGLSTATGPTPRPPNVLEAATVRPPNVLEAAMVRPVKDRFFLDEGCGEMDGLMLCTEGLGCESSGAMSMEDEEWCATRAVSSGWQSRQKEAAKRRKERQERQEKRFPPPISSLNSKGQPNFVLRSVRKDGRLEVTEFRVDRPEILQASREDGRLRLDLVVDNEDVDEDEEQEEEVVESCLKEEEFKVSSMGEGFGRCHEVVNHHSNHHHSNNMWRQPCVIR